MNNAQELDDLLKGFLELDWWFCLRMNKRKSKVIVRSRYHQLEDVFNGLEHVKQIKYLSMTLSNKAEELKRLDNSDVERTI